MAKISAAETQAAIDGPNPPKRIVRGSGQATKGRVV